MGRATSGEDGIGVWDSLQGFLQGSRPPVARDGDCSAAHLPDIGTAWVPVIAGQSTRSDVGEAPRAAVGTNVDVEDVALPLKDAYDLEPVIGSLVVLHGATGTKVGRHQGTGDCSREGHVQRCTPAQCGRRRRRRAIGTCTGSRTGSGPLCLTGSYRVGRSSSRSRQRRVEHSYERAG